MFCSVLSLFCFCIACFPCPVVSPGNYSHLFLITCMSIYVHQGPQWCLILFDNKISHLCSSLHNISWLLDCNKISYSFHFCSYLGSLSIQIMTILRDMLSFCRIGPNRLNKLSCKGKNKSIIYESISLVSNLEKSKSWFEANQQPASQYSQLSTVCYLH